MRTRFLVLLSVGVVAVCSVALGFRSAERRVLFPVPPTPPQSPMVGADVVEALSSSTPTGMESSSTIGSGSSRTFRTRAYQSYSSSIRDMGAPRAFPRRRPSSRRSQQATTGPFCSLRSIQSGSLAMADH